MTSYTREMRATGWIISGLIALAACGGGDDGDEPSKKVPDAGEKPTGKSVICGSKTCSLPADSPLEPCCKDQFASTCGTMFSGNCQQERADGAEKCPLPSSSVIAVARSSGMGGVSACCASNGECGLDLGVGFGCTPDRQLCNQFPKEYLGADFKVMTCDGKAVADQGDCAPDP